MHSMDGKITILIVCIDDIILIKNDEAEIGQLKTLLSKEFEIKGMGPLQYFLEIEIAWSSRGILVSQRKYTLDLIQKIRMLGCKLGDIPMEPNHKLRLLRNSKVDRERYQLLVGILIYLSHTRPDTAFAVSVLCQFIHPPHEEHMEAICKILKHLKSTLGKSLLLKKSEHLKVEAYTDSD